MAQVSKTRGSTREVSYLYGTRSRASLQNPTRPPKLLKPVVNTPFSVTRSDLEFYTGVTTPGYFKAMRSGGTLPVTPMTHSRHSFQEVAGEFEVYRCTRLGATSWYENWYICTGFPVSQSVASPPYPPEIPPGPVVTRSIANLRDELWDVGTTVAELGKTVSMVSNAIGSLRRAQELVLQVLFKRSGVRRYSPSKFMEEFNSLWLEGRYGWRPLYHDMLNAQEAYSRMGGGLAVMRGAARSNNSSDSVSQRNVAGQTQTGLVRSYRYATTSREVRAFCGGRLDLTRPISIDPLTTAWEVIPYSFVIDWFVQIGSFIKAYSPFATGELLWNGYTTIRDSSSVYSLELSPIPSGHVLIEQTVRGPASLTASFRDSVRVSAQGTMSVGFETNLNIFKGMDIAALLTQAVRRVSHAYGKGRR